MKCNKIPVTVRLRNRIWNLEAKIDRHVPIGHGNPYYKCFYCGQSVPYIDIEGHYAGCPVPGMIKEVLHYRGLLRQVELT